MTANATLIMHSRSQAVRLPKEFRFAGKEVRISRDWDRVILEPVEKTSVRRGGLAGKAHGAWRTGFLA
jgi:antitoxin VapB